MSAWRLAAVLLPAIALLPGCASDASETGRSVIYVAGQPFPIDAHVITWKDPRGYDGHAEHCRAHPQRVLPSRPAGGCDTPKRYSVRRTKGLPDELARRIEARGYDLETLRTRVDQVVLHYDACGTSRRCFEVLHDIRGLSCHFLLDLDGTLYQTLDLELRARHATIANDRSVGVEIANIGAYPEPEALERWYAPGPDGGTVLRLPPELGGGGLLDPGPLRPARPGPFEGTLNGRRVVQYDFTEAQYRSLVALVRALNRALPGIGLRMPGPTQGPVPTDKLPDEKLAGFSGVLGHNHIQVNKADPGPAFDWERLRRGIR